MTINKTQNTSFYWCNLDTPAKKYAAKAGAITLIIVGLLGMGCAVLGAPSFAHTWKVLSPFAKMKGTIRTLAAAAFGLLFGCSVNALIHLHRLNPLKKNISSKKKPLDEVKRCLASGFSGYKDHYGFYYHLACLTEKAVSLPEQEKLKWIDFLNKIHGTVIDRRDEGKPRKGQKSPIRKVTIDCSVELDRIQGKIPQLMVEELKNQTSTINSDLDALHKILQDAFSSSISRQGVFPYLFVDTPYVVRDADNKNVMGVICMAERQDGNEKNLYIHTLARDPSAVKMRMTEKLTQELTKLFKEEDYKHIYCEVLEDNLPAQSIYQKLGFAFIGVSNKDEDGQVTKFMEYKKKSPH